MTSINFNLYGSEGCHLCEQALSICEATLPIGSFTQIDIIETENVDHESLSLVELYGVHIPVLERLSDNKKLFWPFASEQVKALA